MILTRALGGPDAGSSTVEYVVVMLVAVSLGMLLLDVVTGGPVSELLASMVEDSMKTPYDGP